MTEATVERLRLSWSEARSRWRIQGVGNFIYKVKTGMKPHREDLEHLPAIRNEFDDKVDLRVD